MRAKRDKPPAPSEGEKMAALYNIACCNSQTGDIETGLAAFAGALVRTNCQFCSTHQWSPYVGYALLCH
jgi:hypothetical protein